MLLISSLWIFITAFLAWNVRLTHNLLIGLGHQRRIYLSRHLCHSSYDHLSHLSTVERWRSKNSNEFMFIFIDFWWLLSNIVWNWWTAALTETRRGSKNQKNTILEQRSIMIIPSDLIRPRWCNYSHLFTIPAPGRRWILSCSGSSSIMFRK